MFCPHCGSKLATATGRCPTCDGSIPAELFDVTSAHGPRVARLAVSASEDTATALADGTATRLATTPMPLPVTPVPPAAGLERGPLATGQSFGTRYQILRALGAGGMGVVYQAWDAELGVPVALKVIRPEIAADPQVSPDIERRFKRELLLARQVTHRNVVRIHDLGEVNGIKYISMPYVEGDSLAALLRAEARLPIPRALRIARQIARGLVAAHEVGVVHRDLKPENVMITGHDEAIIMDFGIARSISGQGTMTVAGAVVGTLEYMAPEQAKGQAADHRADIYAFGLMLYDLVAGRRRLASSESAVAEMIGRMESGPKPLRALDPHVPEGLEAVVHRCVRPDPAERYASALALIDALEALDDSGELRKPAAPVRAPLRAGLLVTAGVLVAAVVAAGAWFLLRPTSSAQREIPAVSVLVSDFSNATGDSVFDGTLEQALGLALEEASFISLYRRADARALASKLIPNASTLDRQAATLVSRREGIDVLVSGRIEPAGSGYRVAVEAANASTGETLLATAQEVDGKGDVLQALPVLARNIRAELGESSASLDRESRRETFTAASLDAARAYSLAQDLQYQGRDDEAIEHYKRAIAADPAFGRAYSGWAVSAYNLGRQDESAAAWKKAVSLIDRMTEREKYRTLGAYYFQVERNHQKSIEAYSTLARLFPVDRAARANLAVSYFYARDFAKALEQSQAALDLGSKDPLHRGNHALFAMYAGDFAAAEKHARELLASNPQSATAYLPVAMAALTRGDADAARAAYRQMAGVGSARGVSLSSIGLADLELYFGRLDEAQRILLDGIRQDAERKSSVGAAVKQVALAQLYAETGRRDEAAAAARAALGLSERLSVSVPAARVLIEVGRTNEARAVADLLRRQVPEEAQAYARILEAEIALEAGDAVKALALVREALARVDSWLARFVSGKAYLVANQGAAALADFEACAKRRGEAAAIFLDDVPSFRYLAPLPYWTGRAHEMLGVRTAAVENYRKFLDLRGGSGHPLAADARRRVGT